MEVLLGEGRLFKMAWQQITAAYMLALVISIAV
jgi:hypothetical protein